MRIAIVGSGTAGAASALLLSRAGHDVTVFERVLDPQPVGAGIMMQPSGLLVLERLGLTERVIARGSRVSHLVCETKSGRKVLDLHYEALGAGLFGVGLHRGVLFEVLYGALRESRAHVHCGSSITRISHSKSDRVDLVDEGGARYRDFDLALLCDGARSHVRDAMLHLPKSVRPYPWGALWFIAEDRRQRHHGRLRQIGTVPLVSLFVSTRAEDVPTVRTRGIAAWKDAVRDLAPDADEVLAQIHDFDQLTFASYFDVVMPRWHSHRVALLGDAAHATSPQLGQGCNLALCDAAALADALQGETNIERALTNYTSSRRDHLGFYQLATRWLTPFFQSDHDLLGMFRDTFMGPMSRIPFIRREMVRSMAGTKTGIFTGSRETRMPL
jgi:2-polyprenyl-6-methoxyphenol hydroxylase-like FAD-dependent oxidoreductase